MSINLVTHKSNAFALLILSMAWMPSAVAKQAGVIAYVNSTYSINTTNKEIRLINPDGTQDRMLWNVPISAGAGDRIGSLSWHPEGTELAFDSGHNWERTMAIRSIYAISSDGTGLRKITRPPGVEGSRNRPVGTVKFWVRSNEQGDVHVYVQGASDPIKYFARRAYDYQVELTVADWGEGIRQYIRLWAPISGKHSCRFSAEAWVDIIPGQEVDLDSIPFGFSPLPPNSCHRFHSPSWSHDGSHLLYQLGQGLSSDENRTAKISSYADAGTIGGIIPAKYSFVNHVTFATSPSRKNEALYTAFTSRAEDSVYLMDTEGESAPALVEGAVKIHEFGLGLGRFTRRNYVFGIAWLPDDSGFIISQLRLQPYLEEEKVQHAELYRYSFANKSLTLIAIIPKVTIGKVAVSPDGTSIVFERGQEHPLHSFFDRKASCRPCSLWAINIDGSGMHQLVKNGRSPVWSKTALAIGFDRGDANGDGIINIQDVVASINIILSNGSASKGSDCNKDGLMNIQDIVCTINRVLEL